MRITFGDLWRQSDFVNLWVAQSVTQVGTQISMLAIPLIAAITLDASPFAIGVLAAASQAPALVFSLVAGAWLDRIRRRPVLVAADLGRAALLALIPLAYALDFLSMGLLYVVAFAGGSLAVFFDVAYLSYLPALVKREQLIEANSKLEASNSAAQVVGPGLAGVLIGVFGAPFALVVDAISFLGSALLLRRIRTEEPVRVQEGPRVSIREEVQTGLRYVVENPVLRALAGCSAVTNFAGFMFLSVYVVFMVRELGLGSTAIGIVFATGGLGALVGAVLAGPVVQRFGSGATLIAGQIGFGTTGLLVPLALLVPQFALPLVVAAEFLQWLFLLIYSVNAISVRQRLAPDVVLGRVNATFVFLAKGMQPIGSVVGGLLGVLIGLPLTLVVGEIGMLLAVLWLIFSPLRRGEVDTIPARIAEPALAVPIGTES
jgi:MFS family permease